ncbi:unnamed protein product [Staurois parvus]|uniref:Uncharacterized protein n=1 Tax=Staurois parvus TaxID=386267 RepID=A0ABN9FZ67_9NEOB|nr:unnamed protein product [Staurois parvus]
MITEITWYRAIHNSLALYRVTSCDQSQLTQCFLMAARMQPERRRNYCFYSLYV